MRTISAIRMGIFAIDAGYHAAADQERVLETFARSGCSSCKTRPVNCLNNSKVSHETGRCFSLCLARKLALSHP